MNLDEWDEWDELDGWMIGVGLGGE